MSYTVPPTFVDGNALSASQLNTLSDDIEYLYGLGSGVNVAQPSRTLLIQGTANTWAFRHTADFLNAYLTWNVDLVYVDHLKLEVLADAVSLYSADPWKDSLDASGADWFAFDTSGLTLGTWYTLSITITSHDASHVLVAGIRGATAVTSTAVFESATDYSL